jgi:hypothetical protein
MEFLVGEGKAVFEGDHSLQAQEFLANCQAYGSIVDYEECFLKDQKRYT